MALVEKRVCDVYGTTKDVVRQVFTRSYRLTDGSLSEAVRHEVDLSPRAVDRADRLLRKAIYKPGHGNRPVVNADAEPAPVTE